MKVLSTPAARLTIDPHKKRFAPNTSPHQHLMYINCRRILFDVQIDYHLTSTDSEFEIIGNHIKCYGICPKCKGKKSERQR